MHLRFRMIYIPFTGTFARFYPPSIHIQTLSLPDGLAPMQILVRGPTTTKTLRCGLVWLMGGVNCWPMATNILILHYVVHVPS